MQTIHLVTVHLLEIPPTGSAQLLARVTYEDHARATEAARIVGMTQAQFLRTVIVRAADKILEEAGQIKELAPNAETPNG